ncbi:MAG: DNA repair protein RadA, partial [Gammaproteobacteria bacterium]|nr:DNA repair protein RadA [Gammaproteobacteria bacterium]
MAKSKLVFHCTACGSNLGKWAGQCPDCKSWNTVEEFRVAAGARRKVGFAGATASLVTPLSSVPSGDTQRVETGLAELDRVLGGGLVSGSVVLLGGDPGIGKSTLLLQAAARLSGNLKSLYVTGEESLQQIGLRARRLGVEREQLDCLTETSVEQILATVQKVQPQLLIVDSIQTLQSDDIDSAPGSVAQVRESAARLVRYAKTSGCSIVLVGHVTKEGALAGPRILEHMVDAVLYFESDSGSRYRIIRSFKNRFGTVNEIGVFAMTGKGLKQVSNPSAIFLSSRSTPTPGTIVTVTREGTRPMLLEIQALVDDSQLANPRRVSIGLEHNRLAMLLAVLHRHGGVSLSSQDVFLNVVGGLRISETGSDLAAVLAVVSSYRDLVLPEGLLAFGELGLSGELRPVYNGEERLKEAAVHGFKHAVIPAANAPRHDTG